MAGLWNDLTGICTQIYNSLPGLPPHKEIERVIIREVQMMPPRSFVRLAGLSGALSIALAAYGSHGFNQSDADPRLKNTYEIGNKMHMIHSVALLASPMARKPILVGTLMTVGMMLFSGSCYYHALTGNQGVRYVTPYGGMLLIAAWLAMMI